MTRKELLELWRSAQVVETSVDRLVASKPCFLFWATLTPTAAGACDAYLHDGPSAGGQTKISLVSLLGDPHQERYDPPVYFAQGLYIDVDTNVTSVRVGYMMDPDV